MGNCTLFKQDRSPFYNLRVMIKGKRRQFSTGESSQIKAADKARTIMADLKSRGLTEAVVMHSRRVDETPADPTFEEFANLYEKVMATTEYPPAYQTRSRYVTSLNLMGKALRINRLRSLVPEKIKRFIADYQAEGLAAGRPSGSVKTSLNSILRNSAAVFSKAALAGYRDHGLELSNPIIGLKLRRIEIKGFSPLKPEVLRAVWENAARLRDGDPDAAPPPKRKKGMPTGRWNEADWRKPHPEAYLLLLLELGLGLRRHESDKAEKDWIIEDPEGRIFLEVKSTPYFTPKSKRAARHPSCQSPLYRTEAIFQEGRPFLSFPGGNRRFINPVSTPKTSCIVAISTIEYWRNGCVCGVL